MRLSEITVLQVKRRRDNETQSGKARAESVESNSTCFSRRDNETIDADYFADSVDRQRGAALAFSLSVTIRAQCNAGL